MRFTLRECAWEALKALYFTGSSEQACVDRMARWARKNGIEVSSERRRVNERLVNFVRFKPPA
jgi:hypothetical protein